MKSAPIVMVSSYVPRQCGIATFCEEAREFIQKRDPATVVMVISHTDGQGQGVVPVIDLAHRDWWKSAANQIHKLNPYVVHLQHEYGLYEYHDSRGKGDRNHGFLDLLDAISDWPTVVEPHTIHGRIRDDEAEFIYELCERADVVLLTCN